MRALWKIITGILAELSDENAYRRHLARHGRPHSGEEWRRFSEERLLQRFTRPRCC